MRALPMVLLLAGCMGANDETLVDELRVMAVVAEPPEVAPGATTTVTVTVADPLDEAPTAMLWTCADLGDGCLEAAEPSQGATVAEPVDGQLVTDRVAPIAFAGVVGDGATVIPIVIWALACAPELCPVLDLAASAPAVGTDDAESLSEFLGDPLTGAEELPLTGTSLALTLLSVSMRAAPVANPVITPGFEAVTVAAGGSVDLVFSVESADTTLAYGYTSAGGFDATEYTVEDGVATLTWFGPEEPGEATLWVVVNGEAGGSAVWRGAATVE